MHLQVNQTLDNCLPNQKIQLKLVEPLATIPELLSRFEKETNVTEWQWQVTDLEPIHTCRLVHQNSIEFLPNGSKSQSLTPPATASNEVWGEYNAILFSKHNVTIRS